jgi:undecaprenyl-diphosphatase
MSESIILGIIQGITEWLPISSEGAIILAKINLFEGGLEAGDLIRYALFLHLGTFFAALVYLRKEVIYLLKNFFNYRKAEREAKILVKFYIIVSIVSGIVGISILKTIDSFEENLSLGGKGLMLFIGLLLLITALLQLSKKNSGSKELIDLNKKDGIILGIAQGASILPGLSRSGITVATLLLRKFKETHALRLSFLMSLPVILAGNIFINLDKLVFSSQNLIGLFFSFLFGFLTIHVLLKVAEKLNFGWFVLFFALITIFSFFI